jgi:hypothetical protein
MHRRQQRRMFRTQFGLEYSEGRLADNLESVAIADLVGNRGTPLQQLARRTYVAVTETGSEVELGIADAEEEASFHVLAGSW